MSNRALTSIAQRRIAFNTTRILPRLFHSTVLRCSNADMNKTVNAPNFANALSRKFIDQVRKERGERFMPQPTRLVKITGLPITTTTEDIRKLARDAISNGDQSISEVVFCRTPEFTFLGTCVVLMDKPENARLLLNYGNKRLLGGNIIKLSFAGKEGDDPKKFLNTVNHGLQDSLMNDYSGRSVIMTGFPRKMRIETLLGYIRRQSFFPVEGTASNVIELETKPMSTTSKFLVKFDSESEAWRCVRIFHNADFIFGPDNRAFKVLVSVAY